MENNVIYLEGKKQYFTAREILDALQLGWVASDTLTLADLCHAVEQQTDEDSLDEVEQ